MLPVTAQPEPATFDALVRQPGLAFLATNPAPTTKEFEKNAYWTEILPAMSLLYGRICGYSATWIPHSTGVHSIDHFLHKAAYPALAYEWSNYRYVSARFNSRKRQRAIMDPFTLMAETFVLNIVTMFIEVGTVVTDPAQQVLAQNTIAFLHLNDDDVLVEERLQFYQDYQSGEISFGYLQRHAPFLAYELQRQGQLRP